MEVKNTNRLRHLMELYLFYCRINEGEREALEYNLEEQIIEQIEFIEVKLQLARELLGENQ